MGLETITMKENNKAKYLLGVSLLAIWGLVGYRMYQKYSGNENSFSLVPPNTEIPIAQAGFQFDLQLDYRDPFGNKAKIMSTDPRPLLSTSRSVKKIGKIKTKKKKVRFPNVEYRGNIVSKTGEEAAVLMYEKEFLNMNINQVHNKLTLVNIHPDSVIVSFEGEEKVIEKVRR